MPDKRKRDESPLVRQDSTTQPTSSILKNTAEVSFPRGGGSVLTPLELKQVANEAASEVLFGGKDENADINRPAKKKKTSKRLGTATSANGDGDEKFDVVEHINFKTLKPNSFLLGQLSAIDKNDITVSFSDGISGFVTMTHISEQFTGLLEDLDDQMRGRDNEGSEQEDSDDEGVQKSKEMPDLRQYFHLGQWLKCRVISNSAIDSQKKKKKKQKKRIELSLEPQEVNGLSGEDLSKHATVQCSVRSMEDHGVLLDMGVQGVAGFLPKRDIPDGWKFLPGSVFLASVTKKSGRTVTVNFDFTSKSNKVTQISSVDAVMPGQVIDLLCQKITTHGIFGKAFGMVVGFLGVNQLRIFDQDQLKHKYAMGSNIKCRIVGSLVSRSDERFLILSTLPSVMSLDNCLPKKEALDAFPVGYTCKDCTVLGRDSEYLYLALDEDRVGQVHFSKAGELDSSRKMDARVLGYNCVDRLYQLCTDPAMMKLKYLRAEDIPAAELVNGCEVVSVSSEGIHLKLFDGQFSGFVPPQHISDVRLIYPERKFKIGSKVKARVLNVDLRGRIFVTLKKSLVGLDEEKANFITSYSSAREIKQANQLAASTVQRFHPKGCVISFFGGLRGFLPNAEISEVFVRRPQDHLRLGQTVIVKVLEVVEERKRIIVTCKISNDQAAQQKEFIDKMVSGRTMVDVVVAERTKDSLVVELKNLGLRGVIYAGHLSDARIEQNRASLKKIKIGSEMKGLVIDKDVRTHVFNLSLKESLINDARDGSLPLTYEDVKAKDAKTPMHGYIKSISDKGLFIAFNGKFVGLVLPSYAVESRDVDIKKTFFVNQSVTAFLLRTDDDHQRYLLTLKEPKNISEVNSNKESSAINPVDRTIENLSDFALGKVVKGKIKSVKKNQLNVMLADNLFGRVDVAEVFDTLEEIKDPMTPLIDFKNGDFIDVRIIGNHDIKSHKFLPITHQVSKGTVLELSMKASKLSGDDFKAKDIEDVSKGDEIIGFVNNYSGSVLWLTVSPCLKAKISALDLTDNGSELSESIEDRFPLGAALKVKVTSIDKEHAFITVTGRSHLIKDIKDASPGMKVPARILRITEKYVLLDLGNEVTGISFATDALNDFTVPLLEAYSGMKNQVLPATVVSVDEKNSRINLSLRSSDAKTPTVSSHNDLKQGDIVHTLVKGVTDKGVFVYLSSNLEAFVPISKLSDSFIKEWKKFYKPMQSVLGKVVKCDDDSHILLTFRESEVNGELHVLKNYEDIKVGDILNGHVKNVTDFGVFVKLDDTANITGLAHRTEVSDETSQDLESLFGVGDRVKAYVRKISPEKKQVSLSLKASHFSTKDVEINNELDSNAVSEDEDEVMEYADYDRSESEAEPEEEEQSTAYMRPAVSSDGLSLSADFDWTASILDQTQAEEESESNDEDFTTAKKPRRQRGKNKLVEDKTIEINTRAPESVGDFERLIIGNPNSSIIWMNYMAFQLQLSEVDKAREVAERALKIVNFREEAEKLNIWVAMLNLENTFGTDDSLNEVFKRASQYMDSFTIHNKLLSIYQMGEKYEQAEELFKATAKKFGSEKVSLWVSWGDFLISRNQALQARTILSKALQVLPKRSHIDVVRKFAQLEFAKGEPERGRSLFEGLIADVPKRIDLWNVYLDQEIKAGEKSKVEDLFERVVARKLTRKQAKFFFNKWLQFEEGQNDSKAEEYVKAKATEYAEKHPKQVENSTL